MDNESIYLDFSAATPLDPSAFAAMQPYFSEKFYNPSSPYAPAIEVRKEYEAAKDRIAQCIGGRGNELIMTAGATESINLAFHATTGHVVISQIEHHAVLRVAAAREHTRVAVNKKGQVAPEDIAAAIRDDTTMVSIALANNEIGTIQQLSKIAQVIQTVRSARRDAGSTTPLWFHTDASQGLGYLDVNVARLGVDMMTLNAGKVYGPKQVGALWASSRTHVSPHIVGGGQERGMRSGTENVAGVIGFAAALERAEKKRKTEATRLHALVTSMRTRLLEAFPEAVVSGDLKRQLPNFLHISFPGIDAERVLFLLEAQHVYVATGSACAANKGTRSHVLQAIGLAPEVADGSVRITLGRPTTEVMSARATDTLIETITQEKKRLGL